MKPSIILITLCIALTGCQSWEEMGETGEVPQAAKNRTKAVLQAYCESPVFHNIENFLVRALRIIDPQWEPMCDAYFAQKEQ